MITKTEDQKREALTDRQMLVYNYIRNRIANGRPAPTVREICDAFEIRSPNGVICHLRALVRKGWIERDNFIARSIRLVSAPRTEIVTLTPGQAINIDGVMVGVVGVSAGEVQLEAVFRDNQEFSVDG